MPPLIEKDRCTKAGLAAYIDAQKQEVLGPDNMYFTWLKIGREPTPSDAWDHYVASGGAADFARRFADVP